MNQNLTLPKRHPVSLSGVTIASRVRKQPLIKRYREKEVRIWCLNNPAALAFGRADEVGVNVREPALLVICLLGTLTFED